MPQQPSGAAAAAPAAAEEGWDQKIWSIGKNIAMFIAFQYAIKSFMGTGKQPAPPTADMAAGGSQSVPVVPDMAVPFWPSNTSIDVRLYVSGSVALPPLDRMPADTLIIKETAYSLDRSKNDLREVNTEFDVPKIVQDNGTLWAHVLIAQTGEEIDPSSPRYNPTKAYRMLRPLTQHLAKKKVHKTRNLLGAQNETETSDEDEHLNLGPQSASYYHPNFTLSFVPDIGPMRLETLAPAMRQYYTPGAPEGIPGYYPVLYLNTFWQLKTHMTELNSTIPMERLPINVRISTLANWQFSIMASMDEGMKETARKLARGESTPGGGDGSELEMIKETILDTNHWLLGTTVLASVLHMIFELLAFKSDVGHWRKKKDNVGVSVRTILSNVFMQVVIFLYLLDNNDNTSWMILFGQGMGIAVEAWKITKTVNVRVRQPQPGSWAHGLLPRVIVFEDKHPLSDTEAETEEYDKIAFRYMGYVAVPLLLAYAAYSLMYETHKSWYSFIITTLVGSVYAYGFLLMVPSLYINYRLKSVAHMAGRTMAYKFLNTFIDDLFAFTIKMPLLHRLATLRDDVIFFVYLYQAWAYRVDYTRVNEFGQGGDDEEEEVAAAAAKAKKVATKPIKSAPANEVNVDSTTDEATTTATAKGSAKKRKN